MLVSRLLGILLKSQEISWWPKDEPGPAGLGLSSLGLYDICPQVHRIPIGVSRWIKSWGKEGSTQPPMCDTLPHPPAGLDHTY